jgi:hypothetical protein
VEHTKFFEAKLPAVQTWWAAGRQPSQLLPRRARAHPDVALDARLTRPGLRGVIRVMGPGGGGRRRRRKEEHQRGRRRREEEEEEEKAKPRIKLNIRRWEEEEFIRTP